MAINHLNSIKGSLNVITGCGSGLGKATLKWFLKNQSGPILAIDRFFKKGFVQEQLGLNDKEASERLLIKQHDTFDEIQTEQSLEEFSSKFGPIDNVINVAGVSLAFLLHSKSKSTVYSLSHANNLINFNTVGTFNVMRLASKIMVQDNLKRKEKSNSEDSDKTNLKNKCIINTSCISTTYPSIGQTFYAGSKSAIDSMTLVTARELSPFNIRCNTINVGYFDTPILNEARDERVPMFIVQNGTLCPKRLGHPDEFAHFAQIIIENQMINGACIKLHCGSREIL